jgi:ATP-dependent RNA helicase DOB1
VFEQVRKLEARCPDGFPKMDPCEDMGIQDESFLAAVQQLEEKEAELLAHPLFKVGVA